MERNVADDNSNESAGVAGMSRGVSITYGDVAPEAKENFEPASYDSLYDTLGNLKRYNMPLHNYVNPCEHYQTVLDGSGIVLPSATTTANIGFWSTQLTNDSGYFNAYRPISLILESQGQYSSQGFTFTFDKFNNIFPTKLSIQWYRITNEGIEDLTGEVVYRPTSPFYFCQKQVENFNKVVIRFYSLNMPRATLKCEVIDYGYGTVFYGAELRNTKIFQSFDPISSELKISTADFTLDSKSDIEYSFQAKQPLTVAYDDDIVATVFVKGSKRKSKKIWEVNAEDYISMLDKVPFVGGMYNGVPAKSILVDIFNTANVPYYIADKFDNILLTGHIPYTTCRNATMQVCIACMAVVNTAYSDVVNVISLDDEVKQTIPLRRIQTGQSFENTETVTSVDLTVHTYKVSTETIDVYTAEESGTGENILVKFSEPLHDLVIEKGSFVIDDEGNEKKGANYAYINANTGCVLRGSKYEHTQNIIKKSNPVILASEKGNVLSITSATLISKENARDVLNHCYDWLSKTDSVNLKIIEGKDEKKEIIVPRYGEAIYGTSVYGTIVNETVARQKPVKLGEKIIVETEYMGDITGVPISQSYNLNGNIVVKDTVLK